MPYCIVKTRDDDEWNLWAEFGVFEIDKRLVEKLEGYDWIVKELRTSKQDLWCAEFWDCSVMYFKYPCSPWVDDEDLESVFEKLREETETSGHVFVDELPEPLKDYLGNDRSLMDSECDVIRLFGSWPGEIEWRCYVKHTSIKVCTEILKIEELKEALDGKGVRVNGGTEGKVPAVA